MEKKDSLEDFLLRKVRESGYPLEIEVSSLLDKNYSVYNTAYYFDVETQQNRDIDIHAFYNDPREDYYEKRLAPLSVRTDLAIECKKSETHAWVFFTRPFEGFNDPFITGLLLEGQFKSSVPRTEDHHAGCFDYWFPKLLHSSHHSKFERIAIAYDEVKKKKDGSNRKEIFEAVQQLVKFTRYEIHESFLRRAKVPYVTPKHELIFLFVPILVFDGDMFDVTVEQGEPKLERQNHILLATSQGSPYCKEPEGYIIDVVHRTYFKEFMKLLEADFEGLKKAIIKQHDVLVGSAQEARREAGRAKDNSKP